MIEGTVKNGQFRDSGSIRYTTQYEEINKAHKHITEI